MDPPAEYNFARRGLSNMSMGNSPPKKSEAKDEWDLPPTPCPCFTEVGLNKAIEALEKESTALLRVSGVRDPEARMRQHEAEADEDDNRLKSRLEAEEVVSERGSSPEGAPNGPVPQADAEMSPKSRANMNAVLAKMEGKHQPMWVRRLWSSSRPRDVWVCIDRTAHLAPWDNGV